MGSLPHIYSRTRSPRAHLACATPAVLRFGDGQRASGKLHVLSLTGGLLTLPTPISQGSQVKLMFLTQAGTVLGGVEMLNPLNSTSQAFRFTSLASDDQRRLGTIIQATLRPDNTEQLWMEKLRAASAEQKAGAKRWIKVLAGVFTLGMIGLASAFYLLHAQVLK